MKKIILSLLAFSIHASAVDRPPQFVQLAFDGSKNINFWEDSRSVAAKEKIKFTYFISGVYFLADADKTKYTEPEHGNGKSAIGFGGKKADLQERVKQVVLAYNEGNEMASHANGHYDGGKYTYEQWSSEMKQFETIILDAWKNAGIPEQEPKWWADMVHHINGFRAPLLGISKGMFTALNDEKYRYDTSQVEQMNYWPQIKNKLWNFPLAAVKIVGSGKNTLSMDYNFYYTQSGGNEAAPADIPKFEKEMYDTYMAYFKNNYYGNRAPVHIGHHFSLWNKGIYWKVMQRFAKEVCHKPEVVCGTYEELADFLDSKKPDELEAYRKGNFTKLNPKAGGVLSLFQTPMANQQPYFVHPEVSQAELEQLRKQAGDHIKAHLEE